MLYRGVESKMSGYQHEWKAAKEQNALGEWKAQPIGFEGDRAVTGIKCHRLDDAKKPVAGGDFTVHCELVLVAIGQSKLGAMLSKLEGVKIDSGRIVTDEHGFTGRAKWYAGGDCRNGGKEVVNGAAEGKAAARAIHAFLTGA